MKNCGQVAVPRGAVQEAQVPAGPVLQEPTTELGEAAYIVTMALPSVSLAVLVSDAAPLPLSLLLAASPPVAARDERAVCSRREPFARIGRGRSFVVIGGSRTVGDAAS